MIRRCVICGKGFACSPSAKLVTCSPICRSERARRVAKKRKGTHWTEDARRRLADRDRPPQLSQGTAAAQRSEKSGRFDTNINAKHWALISPAGEIIEVDNLRNWARANCDLFCKLSSDKSADQIAKGFYRVKRALLGKVDVRPCITYFGWTIRF